MFEPGTKKVPLVVYLDGERRVIGEAQVEITEEGWVNIAAVGLDSDGSVLSSTLYASFSIKKEEPNGKG